MVRPSRTAVVEVESKEALVKLEFNLDGTGEYKLGIDGKFVEMPHVVPVVNHVLNQIVLWGHHDFVCKSETRDGLSHHWYEAVAEALGKAYDQTVGDRKGIVRAASGKMPMEGSLVDMALDLSRRPYLNFRGEIKTPEYHQMYRHLFHTIVSKSNLIDLYMKVEGWEDHHIMETGAKLFGKLMEETTRYRDSSSGVLSTAA